MIRLDYSFLMQATWGKGCFAEDYLLLAGIVANLKPRTILEIGTSTGLGSVVLASAFEKANVTTIDPNQKGVDGNIRLLPDVRKRIKFVQGTSDRLLVKFRESSTQFDLVFVDGDHSRQQAGKDWANTQSLTSTWIFHDTTQFTGLQWLMQVIRATNNYDVFQFLSAPGHRKHPKWKRERFITGMTLVQHRGQLGILHYQAHRGDDGKLLPRHKEDVVPKLKTVFR